MPLFIDASGGARFFTSEQARYYRLKGQHTDKYANFDKTEYYSASSAYLRRCPLVALFHVAARQSRALKAAQMLP